MWHFPSRPPSRSRPRGPRGSWWKTPTSPPSFCSCPPVAAPSASCSSPSPRTRYPFWRNGSAPQISKSGPLETPVIEIGKSLKRDWTSTTRTTSRGIAPRICGVVNYFWKRKVWESVRLGKRRQKFETRNENTLRVKRDDGKVIWNKTLSCIFQFSLVHARVNTSLFTHNCF